MRAARFPESLAVAVIGPRAVALTSSHLVPVPDRSPTGGPLGMPERTPGRPRSPLQMLAQKPLTAIGTEGEASPLNFLSAFVPLRHFPSARPPNGKDKDP